MKIVISVILLIYLLYILHWQSKKAFERFNETTGDRVNNVTKTIAAAFTKTFSDLLKLKKDLVLKTSGKIHVKVR